MPRRSRTRCSMAWKQTEVVVVQQATVVRRVWVAHKPWTELTEAELVEAVRFGTIRDLEHDEIRWGSVEELEKGEVLQILLPSDDEEDREIWSS